MKIVDYLNEKFPTVVLVPSVYYQWDIGIHFSLGEGIYQFKENGKLNLDMFSTAYKQTFTIFDELFDQNDDLILVTNNYKWKKQQQTTKLKVYQPNLRDKNILKKLQSKTYPYPFEEDEKEDYEMQQFSLQCKVSDINLEGLLKASLNEDFPPMKPRFGCEVIARTAEKLRPLYEKHYDWVDEVDRERIEKGLGM